MNHSSTQVYQQSDYYTQHRKKNLFHRIGIERIDRKEPLFTFLYKHTQNNQSLLDLGCGTGQFIKYATSHFDCTGIDISKYAIETAQQSIPQAKFICDDFYKISKHTKSKKYDVITAFDVFEHIHDTTKLCTLIKSIIKPTGFLAVSMPNPTSLSHHHKKSDWFWYHDPSHVWMHTPDHWQAIFSKNGFLPVRRYFDGPTDMPWFSKIPATMQQLCIKYPIQTASSFGFPIPAALGDTVFFIFQPNPALLKTK